MKKVLKILPLFLVFLLAIISYLFLTEKIKQTENEISSSINRTLAIQNTVSYKRNLPFDLPLMENYKEKMIAFNETFIEINLQEMRTRLYQKGELENEFIILARGNPLNWGGSPSGLYRVENKHSIAYSNSSEVYMPFAIQYYGKYFIHGVPYYPDGSEIHSRFSGGCIRHLNKDAQKIFNFADEEMPVLVIDKHREAFDYSHFKPNPFPEISADGFIIADIESGSVLAGKNHLKKMSVASITKLITATTVLENIGLNRSITINERMVDVYGYTPGFEIGKRYQLIELLYPLLTRSSNQSAEALTGFLGRDYTIDLMNKKADSVMMKNSIFADPSGLSNENVSTPQDLFFLARYIYNNFPLIFSISKGEITPFLQVLRFDLEEMGNKNIFIYDSTFIGGKIGFTNAAGQTALFVFSFPHEEKERKIAMIFLNSKDVRNDTHITYRWLLDNYFD